MKKYRIKQSINNWFNEGMMLSPNPELWLKEGDIIQYNQYTQKYHKIVNGIQDLYLYRAINPQDVENNINFFERIN